MAKKRRKKEFCLNCEQQLEPEMNYCPQCGQENHVRRVPLKAFLRDFAEDYLTFDSRSFKSIIPLLFKPGFLTNEFNGGRRVRYIPPLRVYLIVSVIFFFVLSLDGDPLFQSRSIDNGQKAGQGISFSVNEQNVQYDNAAELISAVERQGMDNYIDSLQIKHPFDKLLVTQVIKMAINKESSNDYMMRNISIMMFFLMPLMAFLMKLLYRRKKMFYIEHLVFSFHIHAFYFLFQTILILFTLYIYNIDVAPFTLLTAFVYAFIALRKVYGGALWKSIIKFLTLLITYSIFLLFFLVSTMFISIMLF